MNDNIMQIKNIPQNQIFIIENNELITDDLCNELIDYINNTNDYGIEEWGNKRNVNCKYVNINNIKETSIKEKLDNNIYKIINYIINYLNKECNIICSGDSGYSIRKIHGPTRLHTDGISIDPIDNRYIPIKKIRNMSIIIALNEDYDGGEFHFPVQDFSVKLKKGQIIAFPPYWTHPHMVDTPTNGTFRYTINTWLYE